MAYLRRITLAFLAAIFLSPCFAENPSLVVINSSSKELKRAAHRLRIPVEQMKRAREVLQEATDLVRSTEPPLYEQFPAIIQMWNQINHPKAKAVTESFINDLRRAAADCPDFPCYQRMTSTAMMLLQSDFDYEKATQQMRDWPEPIPAFGDAAQSFRKNLETQIRNQAISRLAYSEPEKALKLMSEASPTDNYNYTASAQIAQALINTGKREAALKLIDQGISKFDQSTADPRAVQEFENFIRMTATTADSARISNAMDQLIAAFKKQDSYIQCSGTLRAGDLAVDLTCTESRMLNILRNMPMRQAFAMKTLDLIPELKSKLDGIGGLDAFYGSGMNGNPSLSIRYGTGGVQRNASPGVLGVVSQGPALNIPALLQDLKGKAESDPAVVRGKLKEMDADALSNFAMIASYQDPDLADLAIEMAQPMLPSVEPLARRATSLQSLIRASRQVDGEVDRDLLRSGFILADQIREEASQKTPETAVSTNQYMFTGADQLEIFLVTELSRDDFDSAISYVRALENNAFKLNCLIQIAQAQAQSNF
jgi:tetratricopeptide (TPR) repeat protein